MALLRYQPSEPTGPTVRGQSVLLRPPTTNDYAAWAELRAASRQHLTPWEPQWTPDELTRGAFRRRIRHYQREAREDLGYAFFMFGATGEPLLGGLSLSNVRRGVTQAAQLGYWTGLAFAGRGCMTAAVRALVPFAFDVLRLHRLEAACLPTNTASIRVLEKTGFRREGLARKYLKIDGVWQDHVLFALLEDDGRL